MKALEGSRSVQLYWLNMLGYLSSGIECELRDDKGRAAFYLVEIVHEDTGAEASFCLVWHLETERGYILPHPYSYFIDDEPESFTGELQPV